jgi:hypothetical protein
MKIIKLTNKEAKDLIKKARDLEKRAIKVSAELRLLLR